MTAELSQRRPRDAPNIWVPWKVSRVLTTHPATFPEICNGLLFRSILKMCVQNLKFVALSDPDIIGGTQEIWAVPGYAHAPFSPKILKGFVRMDLWIYLPNLKFVHLPVPEMIWGTPKIWGVPGFANALYSPKFLKGFCSMDPVNIPPKYEVRIFTHSWDIRGSSKKFGLSLDTPTLHFLQNFSWASDPVNVSAKFVVRSWDNSDCSFGMGL